jgi:hypothetical protein
MFTAALSFSLALVFSHCASWFSGGIASDGRLTSFHVAKELFFSLLYVFLFVPLIFYVQYWPFYCANRDGADFPSASIVQLFVIGVMAVFFLGVPGTGMVGLVYAFAAFSDGEAANQALAGILTVWHACDLVVESLLLFLIRTLPRAQGSIASQEAH